VLLNKSYTIPKRKFAQTTASGLIECNKCDTTKERKFAQATASGLTECSECYTQLLELAVKRTEKLKATLK
jgi:protein-arginine kinase activator protein McsA